MAGSLASVWGYQDGKQRSNSNSPLDMIIDISALCCGACTGIPGFAGLIQHFEQRCGKLIGTEMLTDDTWTKGCWGVGISPSGSFVTEAQRGP